MSSTDTSLGVINSMTEAYLESLKDSSGKVASLANQLIMTQDNENDSSGGGGISLSDVYPVGSIYMSTENASPASLFGGTWEQIKDKFLLSAGDTYSAGSTGGEATHTLTVNEMPEHRHAEKWMGYDGGNIYQYYLSYGDGGTLWGLNINKIGGGLPSASATANNNSVDSGEAGGSQSHNNMPPYLTVYCWKRIS